MEKRARYPRYLPRDIVTAFVGHGVIGSLLCLLCAAAAETPSRSFTLFLLCFSGGLWAACGLGLYLGLKSGLYVENDVLYTQGLLRSRIDPTEVKWIVLLPKTQPFRVYIGGGPRAERDARTKEKQTLFDMILLNSTEYRLDNDVLQAGDESFLSENRRAVMGWAVYDAEFVRWMLAQNPAVRIVKVRAPG